jgi:hypothetical protein
VSDIVSSFDCCPRLPLDDMLMIRRADDVNQTALYAELLAYHTIKGRHNSSDLFESPHTLPTYLVGGRHANLGGHGQVVMTVIANDVGYIYSGGTESTFLRSSVRLSLLQLRGLLSC